MYSIIAVVSLSTMSIHKEREEIQSGTRLTVVLTSSLESSSAFPWTDYVGTYYWFMAYGCPAVASAKSMKLSFSLPLVLKSDFLHLHHSDASKRHHGHAANMFLLPCGARLDRAEYTSPSLGKSTVVD
jgi:hypothetical protein